MESPHILVVGNYRSGFLTNQLQEHLNSKDFEMLSKIKSLEILICPSFIHIPLCNALDKTLRFTLCGQNCSPFEEGPYTGEVSVRQLKEFGVDWVLIGHNERRQIESSELIAKKVKIASDNGLGIIFCIGENSVEIASGFVADVIEKQIKDVAHCVGDWSKVVIAYEPVWSFETGVIVHPEQIIEIKLLVNRLLEKLVNPSIPAHLRFIYGAMPHSPLEFLERGQINGYLFSVNPESNTFIQTLLNLSSNKETNPI